MYNNLIVLASLELDNDMFDGSQHFVSFHYNFINMGCKLQVSINYNFFNISVENLYRYRLRNENVLRNSLTFEKVLRSFNARNFSECNS